MWLADLGPNSNRHLILILVTKMLLGFITQLVALYRPRKINKETKISGEFSFSCNNNR